MNDQINMQVYEAAKGKAEINSIQLFRELDGVRLIEIGRTLAQMAHTLKIIQLKEWRNGVPVYEWAGGQS